jgi:hypothetical protein
MSRIITIKPSPLSKRFTSYIGSMEKMSEVKTADGRVEYRSIGEYKQQRLPNSSQREMPIAFSSQKRKWMLKGFEENSDELNGLVKKCNLINDMPKHPDFGRNIEHCDIYNLNDPFFNNLLLRLMFTEGEGVLRPDDNPRDKILYAGILANYRFQISGDKVNPALSARAKYIVVDKEIDAVVKTEKRNKKIEAYDLLKAMSDDKKLTVAMAMGLVKSSDIDRATIDDVLWEAVEDDKSKYLDSGTTKQEYFLKIAKSDVEDLNIRKTIQTAITKGIIKREKDLGFTAFGGSIGKDKQQVTTFLLKPENSELLIRIEQALENI